MHLLEPCRAMLAVQIPAISEQIPGICNGSTANTHVPLISICSIRNSRMKSEEEGGWTQTDGRTYGPGRTRTDPDGADGPGRTRDPDGPGRTDGRTDSDGRTDGRSVGRTHQLTKLHYKDKVHPVDDCLDSPDANLYGGTPTGPLVWPSAASACILSPCTADCAAREECAARRAVLLEEVQVSRALVQSALQGLLNHQAQARGQRQGQRQGHQGHQGQLRPRGHSRRRGRAQK